MTIGSPTSIVRSPFRGTAAYDGIGADYNAVTGKVWLNVPLN